MRLRDAPFALRVVQRKEGIGALVYRRQGNVKGHNRLHRIARISNMQFNAGLPLFRDAAKETESKIRKLSPGPSYPLADDMGARVACYALVAKGLRNPDRLTRAMSHLRSSDGTEAAWWLGLVTRDPSGRALRALRVFTEAVK